MFKRFALIVFILTLLPLSALAVDSPKEAELQLLLHQALIQQQYAQKIVRRDLWDPRWSRLAGDSFERMVDACMDYIRLYGRKRLDKYMVNKLTEIAKEYGAEFRGNLSVYLYFTTHITSFFQDSVSEAQDNINKGAPSPLAKTRSSPSSKSASKPLVMVPYVIRSTLEQAKEILERAGLKVGRIDYVCDTEKLLGIILSQDPRPGEEIPRYMAVNLTINADSEDFIPQTP